MNMFHGDTIFWDVASKIIHIENQVSLGAGETLASKVSFEQWLAVGDLDGLSQTLS